MRPLTCRRCFSRNSSTRPAGVAAVSGGRPASSRGGGFGPGLNALTATVVSPRFRAMTGRAQSLPVLERPVTVPPVRARQRRDVVGVCRRPNLVRVASVRIHADRIARQDHGTPAVMLHPVAAGLLRAPGALTRLLMLRAPAARDQPTARLLRTRPE